MQTVKTGKEKQEAYSQNFRLLNKALGQGFYLEGVAISYAVIEDRLVAFLHHAGIVSRNNDDLRINRSAYPYMRILLNKDKNYSIRIKDISVKISLVLALLNLSEDRASEIDSCVKEQISLSKRKKSILASGYMYDVVSQINKTLDKDALRCIMSDLSQWRNDRNVLIHALLNKTVSSVESTKKKCAETGKELARAIDNYLVKPFKMNNRIRKKYNIQ